MAKLKSLYKCRSCAHTTVQWLGKCPECGEWETFEQEHVERAPKKGFNYSSGDAPIPISELSIASEGVRFSTGIGELDRVLGGGIVRGSAVLVGGDPGIGKSTLMLQAMGSLAEASHRVLYVSGEESPQQIRLRGARLGVLSDSLIVYSETSLEKVFKAAESVKPDVIVIDSIQTVYSSEIESSPGSMAQVREVSAKLISFTKKRNIPLFIVGHVTKDGSIAGPKTLEHMVDTVLYFEGESGHSFRILRAVKNRFGSIMEIGIFEMREEGLVEVANPSEFFLAERPKGASGSAVVASLEGTRTILVEIQSLVCKSVYGMARRTVVGLDLNKVMLLAAVLEKKAGIALTDYDIFVKVAGGIRLDEPAVDLGVIGAISSNYYDRVIREGSMLFGEVGLAGEVRAVSHVEQRVGEAEKLGFARCILPKDNLKAFKGRAGKGLKVELVGVSTVGAAIEALF
jgi:DNA repair protein RadA/Sms